GGGLPQGDGEESRRPLRLHGRLRPDPGGLPRRCRQSGCPPQGARVAVGPLLSLQGSAPPAVGGKTRTARVSRSPLGRAPPSRAAPRRDSPLAGSLRAVGSIILRASLGRPGHPALAACRPGCGPGCPPRTPPAGSVEAER